jgi:hypothetical protein
MVLESEFRTPNSPTFPIEISNANEFTVACERAIFSGY